MCSCYNANKISYLISNHFASDSLMATVRYISLPKCSWWNQERQHSENEQMLKAEEFSLPRGQTALGSKERKKIIIDYYKQNICFPYLYLMYILIFHSC